MLVVVIPRTAFAADNAKTAAPPAHFGERESDATPVFFVAEGLNTDGSLVANYQRGLRYARRYFGNYGPYYIYLMGPSNEENIREIYRSRAATRTNATDPKKIVEHINEFLQRPNVVSEIKATLAGKAEGGLTWTQSPPLAHLQTGILAIKSGTWNPI